MDDEIIVNDIFEKDYEFNAPSAASAVILGRTSNGNIDWKNDSGISLKDINEWLDERTNSKVSLSIKLQKITELLGIGLTIYRIDFDEIKKHKLLDWKY